MRNRRSKVDLNVVAVEPASLEGDHSQLFESQWVLRVIQVANQLEYLELVDGVVLSIIEFLLFPQNKLVRAGLIAFMEGWCGVLHQTK